MEGILIELQEFEDNAYHPSLKPDISETAKVQAMIALREKINRMISQSR